MTKEEKELHEKLSKHEKYLELKNRAKKTVE